MYSVHPMHPLQITNEEVVTYVTKDVTNVTQKDVTNVIEDVTQESKIP
jgi:hypothetical protein